MDGSLFAFAVEVRDVVRAQCCPGCPQAIRFSVHEKMPTSRLGEEAGTHRVDGGVRSAVASRLTTLPIDRTIVAHGGSWYIVSSVVMTLADHLDKGIRLILRLNMDQLGNKPALAVHKLARNLNIRLQRKIAVQHSPSTTSKATNSLNNTAKSTSATPPKRTEPPMIRQKQRDGVS